MILSAEKLKRRFYSDHKNPSEYFNKEARRLAHKNSMVLHAGCGVDSSIGFRTTARMTIGMDLDMWVLRNSDIDFAVIGGLSRLPLEDRCMDIVAARWVLEHLRHPDMFLQETARVLRPGGRLVTLAPNLWHYAPSIIRVAPHRIQRWFVKTCLSGNPDGVFPTFYQANTPRRIRSLAAKAGLIVERLEMLEGDPALLRFSPFAYLAGMVYERMVNRFELLAGLRGAIFVVFCKME